MFIFGHFILSICGLDMNNNRELKDIVGAFSSVIAIQRQYDCDEKWLFVFI